MSSGYSEVALARINEILLDPKYHDILSILKGARNGLVYGVKVGFFPMDVLPSRAVVTSLAPATASGGTSRDMDGS